MILLYLILFILLVIFIRPLKNSEPEYLSKSFCSSVKGFFVVLVFLRHGNTYINLLTDNSIKGMLSRYYLLIDNLLGQLIVVMFFFYSGYGIYEQFKRKGNEYIRSFLLKRFIPTYISFVFCVLLFYILSLIRQDNYPLITVILAFTGWESIGNSNWFMFVTFILYILFFLSFFFLKSNDRKKIIIFNLLSIGFVIFLYMINKHSWWWNTLLCFVLGIWWSYYKDSIESFLLSSCKKYLLTTCCSFIFFVLFFILGLKYSILYIFTSISFALFICLFTMKFRIDKEYFFSFLGNHVFSIYMLQRLVFIVLQHFSIRNYPLIYLSISFIITIIISYIYDYLFQKTRKFIICQK